MSLQPNAFAAECLYIQISLQPNIFTARRLYTRTSVTKKPLHINVFERKRYFM